MARNEDEGPHTLHVELDDLEQTTVLDSVADTEAPTEVYEALSVDQRAGEGARQGEGQVRRDETLSVELRAVQGDVGPWTAEDGQTNAWVVAEDVLDVGTADRSGAQKAHAGASLRRDSSETATSAQVSGLSLRWRGRSGAAGRGRERCAHERSCALCPTCWALSLREVRQSRSALIVLTCVAITTGTTVAAVRWPAEIIRVPQIIAGGRDSGNSAGQSPHAPGPQRRDTATRGRTQGQAKVGTATPASRHVHPVPQVGTPLTSPGAGGRRSHVPAGPSGVPTSRTPDLPGGNNGGTPSGGGTPSQRPTGDGGTGGSGGSGAPSSGGGSHGPSPPSSLPPSVSHAPTGTPGTPEPSGTPGAPGPETPGESAPPPSPVHVSPS